MPNSILMLSSKVSFKFNSVAEIESGKVSELHVTGAIFVTAALCDEVLDVLFAHWKLQKVGKHLLQVGRCDIVLVTLVK